MSVLVLGAFDTLHWGHTALLAKAMKFGSVTVGLSTDAYLEGSKRAPLFDYKERKEALEAVGCQVVPRDKPSVTNLAVKLGAGFYVCGNDWLNTNHLEDMGFTAEFLCDRNITVVYVPYTRSVSTSEIVRRAREAA